MKCPYCSAAQGRCATTTSGRSITECSCCGRVVEERQSHPHHLFQVRAQDNPVCLVTSDLPLPTFQDNHDDDDDDPFEPTGFISAFSTWSLEPTPLYLQSSLSFSGHLAELERTLESTSSSSSSSSSSTVVVDNLRAYMQIIDVASILGLDCDISDHAFQLFRDCCSATCLRNRSVEALATAALVQAIREAQEPRTLQEISIAANVPQKEIGKYIKILGEALQLSQPINSNSISVHMPRFCTLLQLNKSAQVFGIALIFHSFFNFEQWQNLREASFFYDSNALSLSSNLLCMMILLLIVLALAIFSCLKLSVSYAKKVSVCVLND